MQHGHSEIDEALWETEEQAKARWLVEHPDRKAEFERVGERVWFIRHVLVRPPARPIDQRSKQAGGQT
jgi:hypothetical protein